MSKENTIQLIKQILNRTVFFGGQEHSGWLPENVPQPRPTPLRRALLDISIYRVGTGSILKWYSQNTSDHGDTWHETLEDAESQAHQRFAIEATEWIEACGEQDTKSTPPP